MSPSVSNRSRIEPFQVMEVVAAAAAQELITGDVLHLEVGQPSTGAPSTAIAAAQALLASGGSLGYTQACGIEPLRRRIAQLYRDRYDVKVQPSQVVVTAGASGACVLALLAGFDPGARIVVTEPGYPCYRQMMTALGIEAVPVRVDATTGFLLTAEALDSLTALGPIDGVMVASPANPTGTVYDRVTLDRLSAWCRANDARLIADEIYHGITFDGPAPTALTSQPDEQTVVIGSFSKYFSMTGWRLGWMIVPDELIEPIDRLSQNLYLSPPTLSQHAALAAFDAPAELDGHVARYSANRDILRTALTSIGVAEFAPCNGAFYLYGRIDHWGIDSRDLCRTWLADLGVATAPGVDFDPVEGHRWMRWSVAGATDDITEAAARLVRWGTDRA